MKKQHNEWTGRLGFILATAGAAIGLGNLWKFPYLMGENGGFSFLIAYLLFVCILGVPVMLMEMSLGRKSGSDPVQAYKSVHPHAKIVGIFGVLAAFIIMSYYSIIGGWIIKYVVSYATTWKAPADFGAFIGEPVEPLVWFFLFLFITGVICLFGTKGIENASKVMMPGLFVILLIIIARSVTLQGAEKGIHFIFEPKLENFTLSSVNAALGQVFYSLSLCMGITITYGSYLKKSENIPKNCMNVAVLDTIIAVMAGIAIFPAVFAFGKEPGQGPSLIFQTLPDIFGEIVGGSFFALLFFVLVFFAAVTSAIALLEVVVSYVMGAFGWKRKKAVIILTILIFLLGVPSSLSFGVLSDFKILNYNVFDFACMLTDNILLPLGGVFMCYYIGWKWNPRYLVEEAEQEGVVFKLKKPWIICIRFLTPIMVGIVTVSGFINIYNTVFK